LIKELQSLALDIKILSNDDHEIQIKDVDFALNEREKAIELGMDLPDLPMAHEGEGDKSAEDDFEPEEDLDQVDLDEKDFQPRIWRRFNIRIVSTLILASK
jgi:DNA-directed RNA polymerase subunit beta